MVTFVDPMKELIDPVAEDPIPDLVDNIMSFADNFSISHWVLEFVGLFCDGNPAEQAGEWVSGDWNGLARCSDGLKHLKKFNHALNEQVQAIKTNFGTTWQGNAADAAAAYFAKLEVPLQNHATTLDSLASQYHKGAYEMWGFAKAIGSLLESLLDWVIDGAIALAAGAITSETGIGAVIGGGLAAFAAWKAAQLWLKALDMWGKTNMVVNGVVSTVAGATDSLRSPQKLALPAGAYDNPQA
ncbi:hypothetical protein D5S17_14270 [Pseudonocardiaceae bacterium YIM PH 21723]|nr:hypothetical protein D5S17_14270 [Pseudonocardiaceae bacterium YIM PH 21723]